MNSKKIIYFKRSFAGLFLLLFTVLVFKFLFFTSFIKSHKKDFRKQLIEQHSERVFELKMDLNEVLVDKPGLDWKEKGKELVINGVYHEVVKIKKVKDHAIVSLIEDSQENELFNKYFCLNENMRHEYCDLMKLLLDFNCIEQQTAYNIHTYFVNCKNISQNVMFTEFDYFNTLIKPPQKLVI